MMQKEIFFNQTFDKTRLKVLILWCLTQYGNNITINFIEDLKNLGFFYASQAGLSLNIDDLKIPPSKANLIVETERLINQANYNNKTSKTTPVEYFQNIIDLWYKTSELIRYNVIQNFNKTDKLNPVFMMAFSGARGNISQVRQLVGMRGLMADPEGQILNFPIRSNFREGLSLTEYIISCYGARKGLVDTALKTANSGYLTRRLVDVAQHVIISQYDCKTKQGIFLNPTKNNNKIIVSLEKKAIGRVLAENIFNLGKKNQIITVSLANKLNREKKKIFVRSPLSCNLKNSICQLCYGWNLSTNKLVSLGECVGILAAQSIGEPGTQLTMRTFHTGGVFSGDVMQEIRSPSPGIITFKQFIIGNLIRTLHGQIAFLTNEKSTLYLTNSKLQKKFNFDIPKSTILFVKQKQTVKENQLLAEFSFLVNIKTNEVQTKYDIRAKQEGEIFFENILLLQNKTRNNFKLGLNFGTLWILEGKIYQSTLQSNLFISSGDLIDKKSIVLQSDKIVPYFSTISLKAKEKEIFFEKKFKKSNLFRNFKNINFFVSENLGKLYISKILYKKIGYFYKLKKLPIKFFISTSIESKDFNKFVSVKLFILKNKKDFILFQKKKLLKDSFFSIEKTIYFSKIEKNTEKKKTYKILTDTKTFKAPLQKKKAIFEFVIFNEKKLNQKKIKQIQSLKKNPYQKNLIRKKKFSIIFSKNSNKVDRLNNKTSICFKNINKKKQNIKIVSYSGWFLFYNSYYLIYIIQQKKYRTPRNIENFFSSQNVYKQIIVNNLKFLYFSKTKILKIRKLVKNTNFYSTPICTSISRNQIFLKNIKKSENSFLLYKKIKKTIIQKQVKKKFFYKQFFNKTKLIEKFKLGNFLFNQQKKYKIKINLQKLHFERKNISKIYKFKYISTSFIINFYKNDIYSRINIKYKFPQNFLFSKTKALSEKKLLNIKKNLKIQKNTILENSILYRYSICSPVKGEVTKVKKDILGKHKTIFLTNSEKTFFIYKDEKIKLFIGKVIRIGDQLTKNLASNFTGQIIEQTEKTITIRKADPYLFSIQSLFHIKNSDFVEKNNLLMTLFYQKLKNEDIIQGIPKIEELFEARNYKQLDKKKENIHNKLELCFHNYKKKYPFEKALQKSIKTIQQILVHSIQKVYQEQGVFIADKHIEIIVRQMTTKVFICESDKSGLLQGELIDIKYIESINFGNTFKSLRYKPVLLGITKASLETESFISAASFQETTRILSNSVIEQKTDFLRGLKENVIVGHLIPAGTGFEIFSI